MQRRDREFVTINVTLGQNTILLTLLTHKFTQNQSKSDQYLCIYQALNNNTE